MSRSNLVTPGSVRSTAASRPNRARTSWVTVLCDTMVWKSGCRVRDRSGLTASTTASNGRSAWSSAARSAPRTRFRRAANVGSPDRSARSTTVFTKKPTRPSRAGSDRPATGLPRGMSSPAPSRWSRVATAACTTMKTLVPDARARRRMPEARAAGTSWCTMPPALSGSAGRGRSAGGVASAGSPASASRQYAACRAAGDSGSAGSPRASRCQSAKSAYCTGSGANSGASPRSRAA